MGVAGRVAGETLVGRELRAFQHVGAEAFPFALVLDRQRQYLAGRGAHRAVRGDRRVARARPDRVRPAVVAVQVREAHPLAERLQHGDLERLSLAGPGPLVQRGEHPGVGVHPGRDVRDGDPGLGRVLGRTGDRDEPRFALDEQVVGLAVGVRPARAVPGDVARDEAGLSLDELGGRDPEAFGSRRREVLYDDVGACDQPLERVPALVGLQVERDALLAAVQPDEVARLPLHGRVVPAREVALPRPLDLDHPGAEVGQLARRERRGHRLLDGDDERALQRSGRAGRSGSGHRGSWGRVDLPHRTTGRRVPLGVTCHAARRPSEQRP